MLLPLFKALGAQRMIGKWKWAIASLTLITLPVSLQLVIVSGGESNFLLFLGMTPLFIGLLLEGVDRAKVKAETGEEPPRGSPAGNILAVILGVILLIAIVVPLVWTMASRLIEIWFQ